MMKTIFKKSLIFKSLLYFFFLSQLNCFGQNDDFIPLDSRANRVVERFAFKLELSAPVSGRITIGLEHKLKQAGSFSYKLSYFLPYFKTGTLLSDNSYNIPLELGPSIGGGIGFLYRFSKRDINLGARKGLGIGLDFGYCKYREVVHSLITLQLSTQYYHQWMLGRKRFIEIEAGPSFGLYAFRDSNFFENMEPTVTNKWWGTVFLRLNYARLR